MHRPTLHYRIFSIYRSVLPIIICLAPLLSHSQSVWDNPKKGRSKAKAKISRDIGKIQKLRRHVRDWGLANDYNKELLAGGRLNSNGWSSGLYYFTRQKAGTYNFWELHFSEIKHEKQIKQQPGKNSHPELGTPTPFVFGKINNLYTLQIGFGQEQLLLPGVIEDNLSVSFRYNAGFSLAMLKPYYLQLVKTDHSQADPVSHLEEVKYSDSISADFLNSSSIHGASKWSKGLNETQFIPGLYGEAAFVITPHPQKGLVEAISLGVTGSLYIKSLPIMAELPARPFEVCIFAGLAIGKRWK